MKRGSRGSVLRSIQTLFSVGSVGGMTDGQLLEQFLSRRDEGAEAAFSALVAQHGPMVWSVCRGVLADSHAAEDAFQATFLILVRKASSIRRRDAVGPWLYGVARRIAVRARVNSARQRLREGQGAEMKATPDPDPTLREQLEALHEEVDRLPEKYRAPVVLCHLEGRTHAEAARLLRCPVGTVSIRVSRARDLLRARLTRRGLTLSVSAALVGATISPETASAAMPTGLAHSTIKVAMQVAAGKAITAGVVPASVAQLIEGEFRTMILTKLKLTAAGLLAAGFVSAGVGLLVAGEGPARVDPAVAAAAPPKADENDQEARQRSVNNLKYIGLSMHNYIATNGSFPPAAIRKDGKPLLSWRVAILPFLDQQALYEKFHLDEAWDSPHNKALLKEMPGIYAPVVDQDKAEYFTYYQVFHGPGAVFEGDKGITLAEITDGTNNTLLAVEAAKQVPWTKPADLPYSQEEPLPKLGGLFQDGYNILFADGSVRFLSKKLDPETLRALITRNGNEIITPDKLQP